MDIQVLIVEDDPKIGEIHRHFVEKLEGFTVCGIASSVTDAGRIAEILQPDLILLDFFFPDGIGLDLLWQIRARRQATDIILITAAKEMEHLQEAIRGGIFDYIIKPVMFPRFQETLEKYREHRLRLSGHDTLDQSRVDRLLHPYRSAAPGEPILPKGIDPLTLQRLRDVFRAPHPNGLSADEMSEQIGVSRTTARRYLEYLASVGDLKATLIYGTVGRPERRYFLQR